MTRWTHAHTFTGGLLAGLLLARTWWLLLLVVAAGVVLGALLVAAGWFAGRGLAELVHRSRRSPLDRLIPPDAEVHVISRPRPYPPRRTR